MQQSSESPTSAPPQLPAPRGEGVGIVSQPGAAPITLPLSRSELRGLENKRTELGNQLRSADSRRNRLIDQLQGATGVERAGMEARLALLDERILELEREIALNGRMLSQGQVSVGTTQSSPTVFSRLSDDQITALSIVFIIFVLAPLAFAYARQLLRRTPPARPATSDESAKRLVRVEEAVDTIAIEIERISEGQRFMTRILTEGGPAELGAGERPAEPIRTRVKAPVPSSRDEV